MTINILESCLGLSLPYDLFFPSNSFVVFNFFFFTFLSTHLPLSCFRLLNRVGSIFSLPNLLGIKKKGSVVVVSDSDESDDSGIKSTHNPIPAARPLSRNMRRRKMKTAV
jgi:hypothetical protein